jgi:hypothetical protein
MKRRSFLLGVVVATLAPLANAAPTAGPTTVEVYKSPQCGCCDKWVDHLKANGFAVNVQVVQRTDAYRAKAGIPSQLGSCHTAFVNGYAVEGHVPASDIKRLLAQRPTAKGLVVPQMPQTSPGMDAAHGEAWNVLLLGMDDSLKVFSSYPAK